MKAEEDEAEPEPAPVVEVLVSLVVPKVLLFAVLAVPNGVLLAGLDPGPSESEPIERALFLSSPL